MTDQFLSYTLAQGNNLKDPNPIFDFPGLKPGDHGVCVYLVGSRQESTDWHLPFLEAADSSALKIVPFEIISNHAYKRR